MAMVLERTDARIPASNTAVWFSCGTCGSVVAWRATCAACDYPRLPPVSIVPVKEHAARRYS